MFTEWDQILSKNGGPNPTMNPYKFKQNQRCRRSVRKSDYKASLDILARAVLIGTHPDHKAKDTSAIVRRIKDGAKAVL